MFRCLVLFQCRTPTWSLEGEKRLSIFISPLDLFWAVIKVHLPLRISIMISLTLVYMRHIDCPGLLAHLLLNLRSCEFTQRHVWLMKVRIPCNIAGCFTTSQPTALPWRGGRDSWGYDDSFPYGVEIVLGYGSCLCSSRRGVTRSVGGRACFLYR